MYYQLMVDMHFGSEYNTLSREQKEFLLSITRPQLQIDIYESMTGRSPSMVPRTRKKLSLCDID